MRGEETEIGELLDRSAVRPNSKNFSSIHLTVKSAKCKSKMEQFLRSLSSQLFLPMEMSVTFPKAFNHGHSYFIESGLSKSFVEPREWRTF